MRTVYRYEIPGDREFTLELPKSAEILTAEASGRALFLWALVDRDLPHDEMRRFLPVVVGQPIPGDPDLVFIGMLSPERFAGSILLFEIRNGEDGGA